MCLVYNKVAYRQSRYRSSRCPGNPDDKFYIKQNTVKIKMLPRRSTETMHTNATSSGCMNIFFWHP